MKKLFAMRVISLALVVAAVGCAQPFNPHPTASEADTLSEIVQLTSGFDRAGEAYFSRDMRWMIFQATPKGEKQYQMFVAPVRLEGGRIAGIGAPVRVSPQNSRNTCGYFSPDGNSLIFGSTSGKERPDEPTSGYQREGRDYRWSYPEGMEIFRADGWQAAIQSADAGRIVDLAKHPLTDNAAYDAECAYSPNGEWICFTSNRDGDLELYAMRADGSNVARLTNVPGYDGGPFFSPDGKRILYRSDRKKNNLLQIYVADLTFDVWGNITGITKEQHLTSDANVNWGPSWHPDGKHIVYATSAHGHANYEVYLMRADGSRKTRVTFAQGADVLPVISPDGKHLIWTSKRTSDGTTQVFVARFSIPKGA